jgi:hypothetical protein
MFLRNAGEGITFWSFAFLALFIYKLATWAKINPFNSCRRFVQNKLHHMMEYRLLFEIFWMEYFTFSISCFLQFYDFSFTIAIAYLNFIVFFVMLIIVLVFPIFATRLMYLRRNDLEAVKKFGNIFFLCQKIIINK